MGELLLRVRWELSCSELRVWLPVSLSDLRVEDHEYRNEVCHGDEEPRGDQLAVEAGHHHWHWRRRWRRLRHEQMQRGGDAD